jgi:hypothetical protein
MEIETPAPIPAMAHINDSAVSTGSNSAGIPGLNASRMMKWVAQAVLALAMMLTTPQRVRVCPFARAA